MAAPLGLLASLMAGAPLELPSLPCALCLAIHANDAARNDGIISLINGGKTIAAGWLVCEYHAEVLAHQLAETNYSRNGGPDTIDAEGKRRPLGDVLTLPPAVMA